MKINSRLQKTESFASKAMMFISIIGLWIFVQFGLMDLNSLQEPLIFGFLVLSLIIVELYPMPVWRGFTTISFPLVYTIYIMHGLGYSVVIYAMIVFTINLLKRRPLRIVFFNPAQLIIGFVSAYFLAKKILPILPMDDFSTLTQGIIHFSLIIIPFYLFNNLIVDFILVVRPQPYAYKVWKQKTLQELNSLLISYVYLVLFYVLGSQNRGDIDVISFFFFFSPLVALALLSSIIVRLNKEKTRLKALFKISSELNRKIPTEEWLSFLESHLQEFIAADAWTLWINEDEDWKLKVAKGLEKNHLEKIENIRITLDTIEELTIFHDAKKDGGPALSIFNAEIRTLLYAPLILDDEVVGLFIFGRSRTNSFQEEDIQAAATIANQLAVLIKTKMLIEEQEKTIILEERNRIAREIHDGVAQSLAGAVMKLETAERKFSKMPEDSLRLMHESKEKLRQSLKEVRESIYALRPYPTERIGLKAALAARINLIQKDHSIEIALESRGHEFTLSSMVEKIIFDIFQESVQNAIKHSKANKIEILLSYQKEHALLKVKDDGVGFSLFQAMLKARKEPHFGILHMNEAAEKIHASLQVDSREGEGTEITLTVPKMGIEGGESDD
ncbi:GAF domain-containing sensor histidine kinase [Paenisporosarcina quisquiliarum]|uniref:histidine kinase n=1 Tax=Paenisporosarcina quisquiliarum TaxID=365346 RepID=A0A9X3REP8_9BACL|nr:GAF domain-containing sensor histidine kinase [Paenisporosarcina quisquiliarum]